MDIGYKRVSTKEQSTDRQLKDLKLDRVYEDYISGAKKDRPELNRCLDALREGDTVHVHSVDRMSRSMIDLIYIVEQILKSGASIIIYSPRLEFTSKADNYMQTFQLQLFTAIGQLERSMLKERQREGIAIAKEKGTKSGKPWGRPPLDMNRRPEAIELSKTGKNISQIAKIMNLSRPSISKLLS